MSETIKLRIIGGIIILFMLWVIGQYNITGWPILLMTFGFAYGYEKLVVKPKEKMDWYYTDQLGKHGGFTEEKMIAMIKAKSLDEDCEIWPPEASKPIKMPDIDALIKELDVIKQQEIPTSQNTTLYIGAAVIGLMVLFPPYQATNHSGVVLKSGYAFLFDLPNHYFKSNPFDARYSSIPSHVDIATLSIEIIAALVITILIYVARTRKDNN